MGEDCFIFVSVDAEKPKGTAPVISDPVQPVEVKEHSEAKLQFTVVADPKPNVEWFKGGIRVKENRRVRIDNDGTTVTLAIKETRSSDQGEYKCVVANDLGTASCVANLAITVITKPEFKEKLKATEVTEGDLARFVTRVTGYPVPELEWYRGTTKLENEDRIELTESKDDLTYTLVISNAQREDAGMYKCVASNEGGKCKMKSSNDNNGAFLSSTRVEQNLLRVGRGFLMQLGERLKHLFSRQFYSQHFVRFEAKTMREEEFV